MNQTVHKLLAIGLRTKCMYMWMGLQTCAAPFANGSHTVRRKQKCRFFARTLRELDAPGGIGCPAFA